MVVRAEQQHVNALVLQATKYGVRVPANPGLVTAPSFSTLFEACQAGETAELADAALYDDLNRFLGVSSISIPSDFCGRMDIKIGDVRLDI
jgi:hypothetical protein